MFEPVEKIITEMQRKPDAQILLEWIQEHGSDPRVREAIDAYFEAVEAE